jgi:hypothetical protein
MTMLTIRPSQKRGNAQFDWLDTKHTFSFASYYDPQYTGFGKLLVINEDKISPSKGFGTHGHRDMEIITYVIEGELEHQDSIGNIATIPEGEVQRMTAGTGIRHSEYNHSPEQLVHLLQIWILPDTNNLSPSYEQKSFSRSDKQGRLCLLASSNGRDNSLKIHQQVDLFASILNLDQEIQHQFTDSDYGWIQMVKGKLQVNGQVIETGDGLAIQKENLLEFKSLQADTEFLLFHFQA